jgi:predicted metal-dependent hydrolase
MEIDLNNQRIPFIFRRSRKAHRLRMQLDGHGKLTLVAPWYATENSIQIFLKKHHKWIEKHFFKIEKLKKLRPEFHYRSGDSFYYFGEPVTLDVSPSENKRPTIKIRGDIMLITLRRDISKSDGVSAIKKAIESFYRKKAEEVIRDRLEYFNEFYGFRYNRVTMRDQKSRWGSCSRLGNLNFNWRLIMAPIEVIDYVVVHELCHLKEMNHSPRYWALVEKVLPEHKKYRKWLRENHYLLTY